jgi:glycosyltransferase involved in cell wall biosynthesis
MGLHIKRILLVTYYLPSRGHGGGLRLLDLYGLIRRTFPQVRIDLVACRHSVDEGADQELHEIFDDIHLLDPDKFNPEGFLLAGLLNGRYDVVDLQYLQSGRLIRAFRRRGAGKIIFSPMESMTREAKIVVGSLWKSLSLGNLIRVGRHLGYAAREVIYALRSDRVLCVSEQDASTLRIFRRRGDVFAIETGVSPVEFPKRLGPAILERRLDGFKRVLFVAFFGSATNRDALAWYLREVHPVVAAGVPEYRFEIVGQGLGDFSFASDENVKVVGKVDSIETQLEGAWVGIAPALSGAGLRGKINQYAIAGVPCVASSLAAEGFAYSDGESICLAKSAPVFAERCIELLSSSQLNLAMGQSARQVCLAHYVWDAKVDQIAMVYGLAV